MTDPELVAALRAIDSMFAGHEAAVEAADRIETLNALLAKAFRLGNDMATASDSLAVSTERLQHDNLKLIAENTHMREVLQAAWEQWGNEYLWEKWNLGEWP